MIDEIKILNKAKFIDLSNVKYFFFVKKPNNSIALNQEEIVVAIGIIIKPKSEKK